MSIVRDSARPLLRVRAGAHLGDRLEVEGCIRVETRDAVEIGDPVTVEVSFGALTDEVVLEGTVRELVVGAGTGGFGTRRNALVEIDGIDRDRLTYVAAVAGGRRDASARAHRRVPADDLEVVWQRDDRVCESPLVDISRGGAFIQYARACELPAVGDRVEVEIPLGPRASESSKIRVRSIVTWVAPQVEPAAGEVEGTTPRQGFGVEFRIADRAQAATLAELVRRCEGSYIGHDSTRLTT